MSQIPDSVVHLLELIRFPSVSTQPEHAPDLMACAQWLANHMTQIGLSAAIHPTAGHPIVVARTPVDPAKRTVLIYGHYDVQPAEPLEEWKSPPFEPEIREGRIWARGSTDNKGQIFAHLTGVAETLAREGTLPVNLIFLIEGEEEVGSTHLEEFLRTHRDELKCDIIAISDTGMAAHDYPTLTYALRGITALEFTVRGPALDLHSGVYGGAVANPVTAAARLVATLHDADGRVAIPGFYDDVAPLEEWERAAAIESPITDAAFLEQTGSPALFGEAGYNSVERVGARPTAEVNGIGGGYQGIGTKTVLPREAFVKLTFRLVNNQNPDHILDLAEAHLRKHCPPGVTLEIERGHSGLPYVFYPNSPDGEAAQAALAEVFGKKAVLTREGGSIPIVTTFKQVLGVDTLLVALASPDCQAHSPNENFPLENFEKGIALNQALLRHLAGNPYKGDVTTEAVTRNSGVA